MTPAQRATAVRRAKAVAFRFADAARTRDGVMVRRVCDGLSREELIALALVLADALPDYARLKVITDADDDGLPDAAGITRAGRAA